MGDGDGGGGGSAVSIVAIIAILILVLLVGYFVLGRGLLRGGGGSTEIKVSAPGGSK
jgi:hypothetical protein